MDSIKNIKKTINELKEIAKNQGIDLSEEINNLEEKLKTLNKLNREKLIKNKEKISPWQRVQIARKLERPKPQDYINFLVKNFTEFHGDRYFGDDKAIIGGIGFLRDISITAIGTFRGKNLKENMDCNFGMPHPEGYRKSLRLAKQAEKFKRPVLFFIDTPGAYCGIEAEERGIAEAIAKNLYEFSTFKVPIISIITGEGGSGGALALAVSNQLYMMENAVFSVISPEGCASILFKDASKADIASQSLKLTSYDLYELGIIDKIIEESDNFENNPETTFKKLEETIYNDLLELMLLEPSQLINQRYEKYRKIGFFEKFETPLREHNGLKEKKQSLTREIGRFFGFK
ncbi:MAG: acetyl-CoA carboxylase carboxyltransferase subunit alpha [Spirochaetes bacterium]|nr:acetyl-CoA carboxylase carboxyltransferase subunit alpha [Spirochaetota bacterium]